MRLWTDWIWTFVYESGREGGEWFMDLEGGILASASDHRFARLMWRRLELEQARSAALEVFAAAPISLAMRDRFNCARFSIYEETGDPLILVEVFDAKEIPEDF